MEVKNTNMKFKLKFNKPWFISDGGYLHVPILYAGVGSNALCVLVLNQEIQFFWKPEIK